MKSKDYIFIFSRYIFLLVIALGNLALFYFIFTPLTTYPASWLFHLFFDGRVLAFSGISPTAFLFKESNVIIELIPACIAGSAYYLLVALNLATPMGAGKRIRSILFLLVSFLILNLLRIIVFSGLAVNGNSYFEAAHMAFWYFGSTILVVAVWFINVRLFKIKSIPVYDDFRKILEDVNGGRGEDKWHLTS